jgi:hypothetical protein
VGGEEDAKYLKKRRIECGEEGCLMMKSSVYRRERVLYDNEDIYEDFLIPLQLL